MKKFDSLTIGPIQKNIPINDPYKQKPTPKLLQYMEEFPSIMKMKIGDSIYIKSTWEPDLEDAYGKILYVAIGNGRRMKRISYERFYDTKRERHYFSMRLWRIE